MAHALTNGFRQSSFFISTTKRAIGGSNLVGRYSLWKPIEKPVPKVPALKRKWQIIAEKKFLQQRSNAPDCYVNGLSPLHVAPLHSNIQKILHLRCANSSTLSAYRIRSLRQQIGSSVFDKSSLGVKSQSIRQHHLPWCLRDWG